MQIPHESHSKTQFSYFKKTVSNNGSTNSLARGQFCTPVHQITCAKSPQQCRKIFENTAGVAVGQAVAMASASDRSVFYYCAFKGHQDTLLAHSNRQFYKNCQIYGTVDFIFGNAAAVFQDCTIYARKPITQGGLVVTAQGRASPNENTGIAIHRCTIMAAPELQPFPQYKAFLGRPWKDYSRTVYLRSSIGDLVDPAGWLAWEGAHGSRSPNSGDPSDSGPDRHGSRSPNSGDPSDSGHNLKEEEKKKEKKKRSLNGMIVEEIRKRRKNMCRTKRKKKTELLERTEILEKTMPR